MIIGCCQLMFCITCGREFLKTESGFVGSQIFDELVAQGLIDDAAQRADHSEDPKGDRTL